VKVLFPPEVMPDNKARKLKVREVLEELKQSLRKDKFKPNNTI
jgi:hypothetical protein